MNKLDYFVENQKREDLNNFLILRLMAASLVVYGHSYAIAAKTCNFCLEPVAAIIGYAPHTIAVKIFFVISGFLVFSSWLNRNNFASFIKSRALRLLPGLVVCVLMTAIVFGSFITTLPIRDYLSLAAVYEYIWMNSSLWSNIFFLPDVRFSGGPVGTTVNGSLWTIPAEARLYLFIGMFGVLGLFGKRWIANCSLCLIAFIALLSPAIFEFVQFEKHHLVLGAFFFAGALLYNNRTLIPLNLSVLGLLIALTAFTKNTLAYDFMGAITISYGVIWIAYLPKLKLPSWIQDYSYGIYLYAFPLQQIVAFNFPEAGPYKMMLFSLPLAWVAGALSWHLVEKPFLSLKKSKAIQQPNAGQLVSV